MSIRGDVMVSGSTDGSLRIWNAWKNESMYRLSAAHPSSITTLDFNQQVLATGSENIVRLWDLKTGFVLSSNILTEEADMVWRIAMTSNYCVVAYQSKGATRMDIMDFTPHQTKLAIKPPSPMEL